MSGKSYFPNNWREYASAPSEMFEPCSFLEMMEWKVAGWELPGSVDCIIRTTHLETRKVKEYVYKRRHAAENKIKQLVRQKTHEFCVTTHDTQHYIGPRSINDDGDI